MLAHYISRRIATLSILLAPWAVQAQLSLLNDEFGNAATLASDWQRVIDVEAWPNDPLELVDIDTTNAGFLTMIPHTNGWYEDYRGPLLFKEVTGDFIVSSRVLTSNRAGTGAPNREYSLAGIMIRAPRAITPATWTPWGERYSFVAVGSASVPGTFQFEVKTTSTSDPYPQYSFLDISNSPCNCGEAIVQTARIGDAVIQVAYTPGNGWAILNRYERPDLPATLQVGLVSYTDWPNVQLYPVADHNTTTITEVFGSPGTPTQPDLLARFDWIRFTEPTVPPALAALDLTDPGQVTDADLLSFLGANSEASRVLGWHDLE